MTQLGLEPRTPSLKGMCSTSWATESSSLNLCFSKAGAKVVFIFFQTNPVTNFLEKILNRSNKAQVHLILMPLTVFRNQHFEKKFIDFPKPYIVLTPNEIQQIYLKEKIFNSSFGSSGNRTFKSTKTVIASILWSARKDISYWLLFF